LQENEFEWTILAYLIRNGQLEMLANAQRDAALPDIGGALCSTPQSLANAHY